MGTCISMPVVITEKNIIQQEKTQKNLSNQTILEFMKEMDNHTQNT